MSVNYGAIVPPNEGPLRYILKGLFGGYRGGFSDIQYYFHNHHYGENELRDMWEYELDLSQEDVDLVVGHAWEILGREYTYYFLRENCAYQMAQLLEVIIGLDITPANPVWNLPQTLLKNISRETYQGRPLVKSITYHPSRQARLYSRFSSLSSIEKGQVETIVDNIERLDSAAFGSLPVEGQRRVLDTLLDYYQFVRDEEALESDIKNHHYTRVLAARFATAAAPSELQLVTPEPPDTGRAPSLLRFEALSNQRFGSGAAITLRPAYYDSLDADHSHVPGAELKMGELRLKLLDDKVRLDAWHLFSVDSVHISSTGLPGDKSSAWRLRLATEQQSLACIDCLVVRPRGDIGYTFRPLDRLLTCKPPLE